MAGIKQYMIFDKDGEWRFSVEDSLDDYEIPEDYQIVEDNRKMDFTMAYTLVDGKVVEKKGTLPGHSPPPEAEVAMFKLRIERDRLLIDEVDRMSRIYTNQNKDVPKKIIDYRQELLDFPDNADPKIDSKTHELTNVTWPDVPTE